MSKKTPIEQHVKRWLENRDYAMRCIERDCDWLVTSLFYGVLHGTQALLVRSGLNPRTHTDRNTAIRELVDAKILSRDFKNQYRLLREASNHARYAPQNTKYTTHQGVQEQVIDLLVNPIEQELRRKLTPGVVGTLVEINMLKATPKISTS